MVRIINICSGKGGVGKTTVAANLGAALHRFGRKVAVIDCNLTTAHLGLYLGIYSFPKTLNSFLRNEASLEEAIYVHSSGLSVVPASLQLKDLVDTDIEKLNSVIRDVFCNYDMVFLDSAPGLGKEAMIPLRISDETIFVANPFIPSAVDIAKYSTLPVSPKITGIILNRVKNKKYELTPDEIMSFTEIPVIGIIPEDENILKSANKRELAIVMNRNSQSSKAFFEIAAKLSGIEYKRSIRNRVAGFFRRNNRMRKDNTLNEVLSACKSPERTL
jgi:septum site-determining protein MinD